jgi:gamma-glutamyltranspeptidase
LAQCSSGENHRRPWSGIGGSGLLVYGEAKSAQVKVVDFTLSSAAATDPERYPLSSGLSTELFGWPMAGARPQRERLRVHLHTGLGRGAALSLENFGRKSFAEVIEPAPQLAEKGLLPPS